MPPRSTQVLAVLLAVLCLIGASALSPAITDQRRELRLVYDVVREDTTRFDSLVATAALGSFRGLFTNVLWYHAEQQKQAGRLFDANDTAQLITTLQPRFPQAWAFNAWNMAYNISVITHTPGERWGWVKKGIDLLRSRAIPNNPTSVRLYRELSWIFFHKVGRWSDDMHWHYKRELAAEWQRVLATPVTGLREDQAIAAFEPIAAAAERYFLFDRPPRETRDELERLAVDVEDDAPLLAERLRELKWADAGSLATGLSRLVERQADRRPSLAEALRPLAEGAAERLDAAGLDPWQRLRRDAPGVSPLLASLDDAGMPLGRSAAADHEALMNLGQVIGELRRLGPTVQVERVAERFRPEARGVVRLMLDPRHAGAWATLLPFLRAQALTRVYAMDAAFMHEVMRRYGPLDWRHPASHAIYWSAMGMERSELLRSPENTDFVNTQRQIVHGLQTLMHEGRLAFDPLTGDIDLLPDVRFIEKYEIAAEEGDEVSALYRDLTVRESHFDRGRMNFLADAVVYHYLYGDENEARRYLKRLRDEYGDENPDRFNRTLESFVYNDYFAQGTPSRSGAIALVEGQINAALSQGLAYGRFDLFERLMRSARVAHENYQEERDYDNPNAPRQRLQMPAFRDMLEQVFASYLQSPAIDLVTRARVYNTSPTELRLAVYGQVRPTLADHAAARGFAVEAAFPPPPGYTPPELDGDPADAPPATPDTVERF